MARRICALAALLTLFLALCSVSFAQDIQTSRDPAVISTQLRTAAGLGRQTLDGLQRLPAVDTIPIDPQVLRTAHQAYVLIRAARHGLSNAIERQKYPDPLLELAFKRVDAAWELSRTPVDKASWGMSRQEYLSISIRDLTRALQLVDQALALLP